MSALARWGRGAGAVAIVSAAAAICIGSGLFDERVPRGSLYGTWRSTGPSPAVVDALAIGPERISFHGQRDFTSAYAVVRRSPHTIAIADARPPIPERIEFLVGNERWGQGQIGFVLGDTPLSFSRVPAAAAAP